MEPALQSPINQSYVSLHFNSAADMRAVGGVAILAFHRRRRAQDRSIVVILNDHLRRNADHIAQLSGWKHLGIGSDLDGSLGREESPVEIDTVADLHKVGSSVPAEAREAVLSTNWLQFLRSSLPKTA